MEEIILMAEKLCEKIDKMAEQEISYCQEICLVLEAYSWEIYRMKNALKQINEGVECYV